MGHQKMAKIFDAWIELEMAPAPQGVKSTSTSEVDKPWVDVDRADEAVEGTEKSTRSDAGAQNSLWIKVNAVAAEPDHMDQVGEGGLSLVFGHLQPQGDAIHDWYWRYDLYGALDVPYYDFKAQSVRRRIEEEVFGGGIRSSASPYSFYTLLLAGGAVAVSVMPILVEITVQCSACPAHWA